MDLSIATLSLLGINLLYGVIIVFLFAKYTKLLKKQKHDEFDFDRKTKEILNQAVIKAKEIIEKTELLTDETQADLKRALSDAVGEIEQETAVVAKKVSKDIVDKASEDIERLVTDIAGETKAVKGLITNTASQGIKRIEQDLEDYRKLKLESIENEVEARVQMYAKKIFGKALTTEEHKQLITQALEQAKKDNVF